MRHILNSEDFYTIFQPDSSFISRITFYFGFDDVRQVVTEDWGILQVTLNGVEYEYRDFPLFLFIELANSESLGRFFNQRIRNNYYADSPEY